MFNFTRTLIPREIFAKLNPREYLNFVEKPTRKIFSYYVKYLFSGIMASQCNAFLKT